MACFAPCALANWVTAFPTEPPIAGDSTVLPFANPARLSVIWAVRYATGTPAAERSSMLSGIKQRFSFRTASHSAYVPSSKTPYGPVNITREPTGMVVPPPSSTTPAPFVAQDQRCLREGELTGENRMNRGA